MPKSNEALTGLLIRDGICNIGDLYSAAEIANINAAVDPIFAQRQSDRRSYVHVDEMMELGLFNSILSDGMRSVLFAAIEDPVLYHCHIYEIAGNDQKPHIFGDRLGGWHRDHDSELLRGKVTHISVFVYLKDVGSDDGPFEFVPVNPRGWLHARSPYISVTGSAGYSFVWQRSFYHRAAPNRGPRRRRLLKISVQANRFRSRHLENSRFAKLKSMIPVGDAAVDLLLGRYQGKKSPRISGYAIPSFRAIPPTNQLLLSNLDLAREQLFEVARAVKHRVMLRRPSVVNVAYD